MNEQRSTSRPKRGLRRVEAANYIGVSARKFDDWVLRGVMPEPKRQDGVVVWDVVQLDMHFEALPQESSKTVDDGGRWA
jgi:hypothetical protein